MTHTKSSLYDVAVVGGGATGIASAITAAQVGLRVALFAPAATFPPGRTAALMQGSIDFLSEIDAWSGLEQDAAPLTTIRLVDATARLIRAPETTFYASEIGLPAFGYNIQNGVLVDALRRRAAALTGIETFAEPVESVEPGTHSVRLTAGGQDVSARLVVAADGARSLAREAAGIRFRRTSYRQSALVATLSIRYPHEGVSTEFHTEAGPFTLVPMIGERVSLVWADRPDEIERAMALDAAAFSAAVEARARSIHGAMRVDSEPAVFPLGVGMADRFAARRIALVGEAAHIFSPIGAQGLNLGFRDVAALKHVLARHRADPGAPEATDAFHAARRADVRTRTIAVDLMNRSLLTDFLPVQAARGIALTAASAVPLLRRALMRQGVGRTGTGLASRLLRGEA